MGVVFSIESKPKILIPSQQIVLALVLCGEQWQWNSKNYIDDEVHGMTFCHPNS
jgi:hypothetical protein